MSTGRSNAKRGSHPAAGRDAAAESTTRPRAHETSTGGEAFDSRLSDAVMARQRVRTGWTTADIIDALSATCDAWRDRRLSARRRTVAALAETMRTSPELLERGIDFLFSAIDAPSMHELVRVEASRPEALDRPVEHEGARARLLGPPIVFHLLAGNVPGLSVSAVVCALLARSACVVRDSSRQPLLTEGFLATLAEHAPDLAAMVVPVAWERSDHRTGIPPRLRGLADRVELYGSADTIGALSPQFPAQQVVERGPRVSVGLVPAETAAMTVGDCAPWIEGFVSDLCLYEGLGCLTPQLIVVEGERARCDTVADALAEALAEAERRWPRQSQNAALEASRRAYIDAAEVAALAHPNCRLLRGHNDAWCVRRTAAEPPSVGPGLRCVSLTATSDSRRTHALLRRARVPLAAVGVAGLERCHPAAAGVIERGLRDLGATLVCTAGRMQAPPLAWQQDGRQRLGDLLSWQAVSA